MKKPLNTIQYPAGVGLESEIRRAETADQADAFVEMVACQIARTKMVGRGKRATPDQIAWATRVDEARMAREAASA